jgi:two-component system sensor histidine kinase KdpD
MGSLQTFNEPLISSLRPSAYANRVILWQGSAAVRYVAGLSAILVSTTALIPLRGHINTTTVAVSLLLVILFVAMFFGSKPALLASMLAMLCFNFFFLPPFHTFTIADPQNWVALAAFFITALVVGQLSARAKRQALEAETGRVEIARLYEDLRIAFDRASEAEALKKSERLKSALLDAVTHDIRTPLTSIKASATLLLGDRESAEPIEKLSAEEKEALLTVINHGADRLDHFVEGIVDLARIDAGDMKLYRNWGEIEDIIDAALAQAGPLTRAHGIEVVVADDLPVVRVDSRAVAEVIYTLLDNASKYASPGTLIKISAERAGDEVIKISVEDQGPGIPINLRNRVFERFFRAASGEVSGDRSGGIGMGLAIAKGIVEAHGGQIWIEDGKTGEGTRVAFTVPVGDDGPPQTDEASTATRPTIHAI